MTRLQVSSKYGGAMAAMRYYLHELLDAPAPDHPSALDADRNFVRWQAESIGWASRD
jgi:hypothetical protein